MPQRAFATFSGLPPAHPEYLARRFEDQTLLDAADGRADTLFETRGVRREFPSLLKAAVADRLRTDRVEFL